MKNEEKIKSLKGKEFIKRIIQISEKYSTIFEYIDWDDFLSSESNLIKLKGRKAIYTECKEEMPCIIVEEKEVFSKKYYQIILPVNGSYEIDDTLENNYSFILVPEGYLR